MRRTEIYRTCAAAFFCLLCRGAGAVDWHISISPRLGFETGSLSEYVFVPSQDNHMLSRLDWEFPALYKIGAELQSSLTVYPVGTFELSGGFDCGFPRESGYVYDYDWQMRDANGKYTDTKTDYSEHDNNLELFYAYNARFDWRFWKRLGISVGWDYRKIEFCGKGGYSQKISANTSLSDAPMVRNDSDKTALEYTLQTNYMRLGLVWDCRFRNGFSIFLGGWAVPMIVSQGLDGHHLREMWFLDKMSGYFCGYTGEAGIEWNLAKRSRMSLRIAGNYFPVIQGTAYSRLDSSTRYTESADTEGGSSWQSAELTLSYRFTPR